MEEVRNHFPVVEKPGGKRQLYVNDAQNNDWSMAIFFNQDIDAYVLMDGWKGFVSKHKLEEMDVIRFYKPVCPAHEGLFLVECVKIEDAAPGTTSQDDQSNDGEWGNVWGDCTNRGDRR
ncbi:hypothetical protein TEA_000883 [Camellia sinensis var. sinensis]|uniref:TF-B3 domain-containing protein n=1 Tax=Camellia sinensis var. sinensis TaxID=542762 RepID=A0A4S4F544_CAMSN|nr:hypothetical protein TEA_000883 [Camellia sinensis var. sinensis]